MDCGLLFAVACCLGCGVDVIAGYFGCCLGLVGLVCAYDCDVIAVYNWYCVEFVNSVVVWVFFRL